MHLALIPGKAFLFRLSDNWDKYEFTSEVPHHLIPPDFNLVDASFCFHETHNFLNISLVVSDYGHVAKQLMLLQFDKISHRWTHITTNGIGVNKFFHPVYTDGLTVVPT